jgi:transposase
MSKYFSLDLRRRAARFCLKHGSGRTAETFLIGRATAVRWADKLRKTGDVAIGKVGGHRRRILEPHENWISERIAAESHVSLRRLQAELNDRGVAVGYGAVQRAVHRKRPQGLILLVNGAGGARFRPASKLHGWSSSTRLGSRPTWHPCAAGAGVARG